MGKNCIRPRAGYVYFFSVHVQVFFPADHATVAGQERVEKTTGLKQILIQAVAAPAKSNLILAIALDFFV